MVNDWSTIAQYAAGVVTLATASTVVAKALVDLVKLTGVLPTWAFPLLALAFGVGVSVLLLVASSTPLLPPALATACLAGVLAAIGAVGVTELQRKADAEKDARKG